MVIFVGIDFSKRHDISWAYDLNNMTELSRFLNAAGLFNTPRDVIYFFENPWKWSNEWRIYQEFKKSPEFEEYKISEHIPERVLSYLPIPGYMMKK